MINRTEIEQDLRHIADMLLLNGTLSDCPGLIHGKTGIALFFFHYARHTGNELFENYAMDLIEEIQSQIHVNSPANYERGIAGIGTGIDYLIRNKYLEADDDIFDDLDQRMYRAVMYDPWQDFSLYHGLAGYGRYWIMRLSQQAQSIQARECLLHIAEQVEEKIPEISDKEQTDVCRFLHDLQPLSGFNNICTEPLEQCRNRDIQYETDFALKQIQDLDREKPPAGMGLLTGYAGEGILRLTALNQTNRSWMNLL